MSLALDRPMGDNLKSAAHINAGILLYLFLSVVLLLVITLSCKLQSESPLGDHFLDFWRIACALLVDQCWKNECM